MSEAAHSVVLKKGEKNWHIAAEHFNHVKLYGDPRGLRGRGP